MLKEGLKVYQDLPKYQLPNYYNLTIDDFCQMVSWEKLFAKF